MHPFTKLHNIFLINSVRALYFLWLHWSTKLFVSATCYEFGKWRKGCNTVLGRCICEKYVLRSAKVDIPFFSFSALRKWRGLIESYSLRKLIGTSGSWGGRIVDQSSHVVMHFEQQKRYHLKLLHGLSMNRQNIYQWELYIQFLFSQIRTPLKKHIKSKKNF